MSKTWKVATREYAENARTKGFWIGILAFPVILALSIGVPVLLQKAVDVRSYAVEDESGWLLQAIDSNTRFPDLERMLQDSKKGVVLPEAVTETQLWKGFAELKTEELRNKTVAGLRMLYATSVSELESGIEQARKFLGGSLLEKLEANEQRLFELREEVPHIFSAIEAMPDKELAQQWIGSARSDRYVRRAIEGGTKEMQRLVDAGELFAYFVIGPDPRAEQGWLPLRLEQPDR